ncbi:hypothetical protein CCUS01_17428, partial [Colletotrichum cuscutae]
PRFAVDKNSLLALVSLVLSPKLDNLQAALRGQGAAPEAAGRGSASVEHQINICRVQSYVRYYYDFLTTDTTDTTARPFFVLFCAVILIFLGAITHYTYIIGVVVLQTHTQTCNCNSTLAVRGRVHASKEAEEAIEHMKKKEKNSGARGSVDVASGASNIKFFRGCFFFQHADKIDVAYCCRSPFTQQLSSHCLISPNHSDVGVLLRPDDLSELTSPCNSVCLDIRTPYYDEVTDYLRSRQSKGGKIIIKLLGPAGRNETLLPSPFEIDHLAAGQGHAKSKTVGPRGVRGGGGGGGLNQGKGERKFPIKKSVTMKRTSRIGLLYVYSEIGSRQTFVERLWKKFDRFCNFPNFLHIQPGLPGDYVVSGRKERRSRCRMQLQSCTNFFFSHSHSPMTGVLYPVTPFTTGTKTLVMTNQLTLHPRTPKIPIPFSRLQTPDPEYLVIEES